MGRSEGGASGFVEGRLGLERLMVDFGDLRAGGGRRWSTARRL
jgi:hypothetical protein